MIDSLIKDVLTKLQSELNRIIVGKQAQVELAVICVLAGGHLLIEDVPGVGKTTLAQALAKVLGLQYQRVQFTSDLMPSDLTGVSIYDRGQERWVYHPGPLFTQMLLADEINRASPKTQSALLEAMEEKQVSIEGATRALPDPFFVIATQNPQDQHGTHPLPESQLDRFLMRISLGYPGREAERELLTGVDRREAVHGLAAILDTAQLKALQAAVGRTTASSALIEYVQALVASTREQKSGSGLAGAGLSPRAALALLRASKACALARGRDYCTPDDVRHVFIACAAHRMGSQHGSGNVHEALQAILAQTPL